MKNKRKSMVSLFLTVCMLLWGLQIPSNIVRAEEIEQTSSLAVNQQVKSVSDNAASVSDNDVVPTEENGQESTEIWNEDFEGISVEEGEAVVFPTESSNWGVKYWGGITAATDTSKIEVKKLNGNNVLVLQNDGTNVGLYRLLGSEGYDKVTLTYSVAFSGDEEIAFLPTLANAKTGDYLMQPGVRKAYTNGNGPEYKHFNYSVNDGSSWNAMVKADDDTTYEAEDMRWYQVKISYEKAEDSTYICRLYIDDVLTNTSVSARESGKMLAKYVTMQMNKYGSGVMYVDNICVTTGEQTNIVKPNPLVPIYTGTQYIEDFEDCTPGTTDGLTKELGWSISNVDEGDIVQVITEEGNEDNQILKIKDVVRNKSLNFKWTYDNNSTATKAVLKCRAMVEEDNGSVYLPHFYSKSVKSALMQVSRGHNSLQKSEDGSKWDILTPMTKNEWHEVEIVVDTEKGVYDIYFDGEAALFWNPVYNINTTQNATLGTIEFGIYQGTANTYYLDDIQVLEYVEGETVAFANPPERIKVGEAECLNVQFTPQDTSFRGVKFESSDAEIAAVDEFGNITGLKEGTVTITATPYLEGVTPVTTMIEVYEVPVTSIKVPSDIITLPQSGHTFIGATVDPDTAGLSEILYESGDENVVTVDKWGEIIAVGAGTAVIRLTAKSYPSVYKDVTVTVTEAGVMRTIYVSPDGTGDGRTTAAPTSLAAALDAIAAINRTESQMTGNIEVILAPGYYRQISTIVMDDSHSGTNDYSVIFKGNGEATIGGAITIEGSTFEACTEEGLEGVYKVAVDDSVQTRQLYVDNVRATRARSAGSLTNAEFNIDFGYLCDDVEIADYQKIEDLELVFYDEWTNSRCGVAAAELTEDGRVKLMMDDPGWSLVTKKGGSQVSTCETTEIGWYENALELLDEPGEWYLDETENVLYYMPRQWENIADVTVTVPVLDAYDADGDGISGLLNIAGSDYEHMVQNIHFEGITFADTTWMRPSTNLGHADLQNNYLREYGASTDKLTEAVITVKKANSIYFTDCNFTRMGITALKMVEGVQNSPITGNHFYDISGCAVCIGEPGYIKQEDIDNTYPSDIRKMMKNCDVMNNYIHDIGVEYQGSSAVSVGFAADMDISYNEFFHIPYSAIHIGYGWLVTFDNVTKNMVISHNFIHDLLESKVYDGGGIYTLGNTGDGDGSYNLISDNYIRNQMQPHGLLYADNGSTYWNFTRNVLDLSETEIWRNNTLTKWSHTSDCEHLKYSYIYTTTLNKGVNAGVDVKTDDVIFDTETIYLCDAENWPQEALDIMAASGLQDAYKNLTAGQVERIVTNISEGVFLDVNDTLNIYTSFTDGKDTTVEGGEVVWYEVGDASIASVTQEGAITGLKAGTTTVRIYVLSNDILDVVEKDVYVGDELIAVKLYGFDDTISMVKGSNGIQLKPYSETAMGRSPEFSEVAYAIADTDVAVIDANGFLKPVADGETTMTVKATAEGKTISAVYTIFVKALTGLKIHDLSEVFDSDNDDQWVKKSVDSWELKPDEQITTVIRNYATFGGRKYQDEVLSFKLSISTDGNTWPSIVLRAQDTLNKISSGTTGYIFCVTNSGLELHRFNGKERTCIYGDNVDWAPNGGTGGHLISPNPLQRGEEHDVMVGAVNVDEGVRIVLVVDGVPIIDFVDEGEGAITEAGYFGLVGKGETFVLTKVNANVEETPDPEEPDESDPMPEESETTEPESKPEETETDESESKPEETETTESELEPDETEEPEKDMNEEDADDAENGDGEDNEEVVESSNVSNPVPTGDDSFTEAAILLFIMATLCITITVFTTIRKKGRNI